MDVFFGIMETGAELFVDFGWYLFGVLILYGAFRHKINAVYRKWRLRLDEYQYSAKYHKDSDLARSRLEGVMAAREKMQAEYETKAILAEIKKKEKEDQIKEKRSQDNARGVSSSSSSQLRSDYLPLTGNTGSGGYKPQKRSCCKKGGGCG